MRAQSDDRAERGHDMFFDYRRTNCQPADVIAINGGPVEALHEAKPVDLFDTWLFAEAECELALQGWYAAGVEEKAAAHAAYSAALDCEERAARILCDRLRFTHDAPRIGSLMRAA
jgi:hypothetical protein